MLVTFFLFLLVSLFLEGFTVYIFFFLFFFLSSFSYFFSSFSLYTCFIFDNLSLYIVFLTVFVLYISYFFGLSVSYNPSLDFVMYLIFFPCFIVFSVNSIFFLYLFYELSLLPILYIILNWGSYPERSLSSLMLLVYTSVFSFPLMVGLFYIFSSTSSFSLVALYSTSSFSLVVSLLIFFSFCVNLPVYGLHYWLPIAHVEAPTFGSIILAGVLLKLGGAGLIRFIFFIDVIFLNSVFLSYFFVFLVFSAAICCFQSDFNRLVAYSSVAHIIAVPVCLLSCSLFGVNAAILLMLYHGLSSPILFGLVGVLYSFAGSRQLALVRGLILVSPFLSFILIFSFLFTLSTPPYVSFFSEVIFFVCCIFLSSYSLPFLVVFALLCLVYNLNWLSSALFSSTSSFSLSYSVSFSFALPLFLAHFLSFLFLFISSLC